MLTFEGEPMPKNHPLWKTAVETGFNLSVQSVADGYDTAAEDMESLAFELSDTIDYMFSHPETVAKNGQPFKEEVDEMRMEFQSIQAFVDTLWNPDQINSLGVAGILWNPALLEHFERLRGLVAKLAQDETLQPLIKRYELARLRAQSRLEICDVYLTPIGSPAPSTLKIPLAPEEREAPTQS